MLHPRMVQWVLGVTYCFATNPSASSNISFKLFFLNCGYSQLAAASTIIDFSTLRAFLPFVEMQTVADVSIYPSIL